MQNFLFEAGVLGNEIWCGAKMEGFPTSARLLCRMPRQAQSTFLPDLLLPQWGQPGSMYPVVSPLAASWPRLPQHQTPDDERVSCPRRDSFLRVAPEDEQGGQGKNGKAAKGEATSNGSLRQGAYSISRSQIGMCAAVL